MTIKKASLSKSRHLKVGYQLYESLLPLTEN